MHAIGAIAAMTRDRVIGLNGSIPWHYSEDFKRFKRVTMGGVIMMGRITWESIGSTPLPGRRNIVISGGSIADCECHPSIEAALAACGQHPAPIWFIGGAQIYAQALRYCDLLDITWVPDQIDPVGAILFPEIDPGEWRADPVSTLETDPRLQLQRFHRI